RTLQGADRDPRHRERCLARRGRSRPEEGVATGDMSRDCPGTCPFSVSGQDAATAGGPGLRLERDRLAELLAPACFESLLPGLGELVVVVARRPDAELERLPPGVERGVLDVHGERGLLDVGEPGLREEPAELALPRAGAPRFAFDGGVQLTGRAPEG